MPTYVYGCQDKQHPRVEVRHGREEVILTLCPTCGKAMHRIPQAARFYINPVEILYDKMDKKFREYKARKRA